MDVEVLLLLDVELLVLLEVEEPLDVELLVELLVLEPEELLEVELLVELLVEEPDEEVELLVELLVEESEVVVDVVDESVLRMFRRRSSLTVEDVVLVEVPATVVVSVLVLELLDVELLVLLEVEEPLDVELLVLLEVEEPLDVELLVELLVLEPEEELLEVELLVELLVDDKEVELEVVVEGSRLPPMSSRGSRHSATSPTAPEPGKQMSSTCTCAKSKATLWMPPSAVKPDFTSSPLGKAVKLASNSSSTSSKTALLTTTREKSSMKELVLKINLKHPPSISSSGNEEGNTLFLNLPALLTLPSRCRINTWPCIGWKRSVSRSMALLLSGL